MFEVTMGVPVTRGNSVEVLRNGDEIFPAMLDAIRNAGRSIDLLTFVYWTGDIAVEFANALADRAGRGVRVRVMLDALGARHIDDALIARMLGAGCTVEWFRPVDAEKIGEVAHRTHRKVLVCDEEVAFTGGVGIAQEWCGDARSADEWRDTHFCVRGPAVDGLRAAFLRDWAETSQPLFDTRDALDEQPTAGSHTVQVLSDDDQSGLSATALAFDLLMSGAEHNVRITTAYFTPNEKLLERICGTAERGVSIEVLVPGEHADKDLVRRAGEATYARLLEAGVNVRSYDTSMLHAKVMTADGRVAVVGSSNINSRSTSEDDEVLMVLFDEELVAELDDHFRDDCEASTEIDPADWADRGLLQRARESIATTVSDVM